jgi:hypothetical protein
MTSSGMNTSTLLPLGNQLGSLPHCLSNYMVLDEEGKTCSGSQVADVSKHTSALFKLNMPI